MGPRAGKRRRHLSCARDDIGGRRIATIATLVVDVIADTKQLNAGLTSAQGGLSRFGALAGFVAVGAGAAITKFAADAVGAASDLTESTNKVNVVFEDSASTIINWAKSSADSMGISEQAALESAGTFGNLFDAMGVVDKAGAEMSMTLVGLASDLASFNNASPEDVLKALQSGLTGQIRPLRQFGIEISEAAIQQEALAEGITKSTSQMSLAEKVQLRYALILKQTGNAQGDFGRTSNELANQQRILRAEWEDLQAQLGLILLPLIKKVVASLSDLITVLAFAARGFKDFSAEVRDAGASLGESELRFASWITGLAGQVPILGQAVQAWERYRTNMDAATASGELTAGQIAVVSRGLEQQGPSIQAAQKHWSGLARSFFDLKGIFQDAGDEVVLNVGNRIPKAFRDTRDALIEEIPAIRGTTERWRDIFTLDPQELVKITNSWRQIARTIAEDLREIGESDLKPRMREAIAALPPEMRHAWVEGNAKQRNAIEESIQSTFKVEDQMPALARQALGGGGLVGKQFAQGIQRGIESGIPAITTAARSAVEQAIAAARRAAAAESPSKKMVELGHDLMEGLKDGIGDKDREVAQKLTESIGKMLDAAKSALSDFRSKMRDFAGGISGGFSSFSDLVGAFGEGEVPVQDVLSAQLGGAQTLADVLDALKRQGASKGLLSQIAGAGPEGLGFAQALLQGGPALVEQASQTLAGINKIATSTGKALSEDFFGNKMDRLQNRADRIADLLAEANQLLRGDGGDVVLQIDGQTFARISRDQLLKLGKRNVTTGIS